MSLNATMSAVPAAQLSSAELYAQAGVDVNSLNFAEKAWMNWYLFFGNAALATGLASFLLHETVYFGRCIPWIIIDAIPYFRKWKIQQEKIPTPAEQWECTRSVLFAHFTVEAPLIVLFDPVAQLLHMRTWQVPFPTIWEALPQIAFFFFFEDMFHYFNHQLLHTPLLYKHIHKIHHKYSAPFGLAAEYAHPLEVLILATGTIAGPLLYAAATGNLHVVVVYAWITMRLFQAIDAHSGYDFPWSLQHFLPFWSGAEHHDFHHMAFVNNFSSSFRWWDRVLGTDDKYRAYTAKHKAAMREARRQGLTPDQWKEVERKMVAEAEKEGFEAEARVEALAEKPKQE
ncbi:C-4 methyl sterol oxidase [Peniophora sp. CONT]|nr:C-4 methyl sterol oxidase [Peniophora sp. CONT]